MQPLKSILNMVAYCTCLNKTDKKEETMVYPQINEENSLLSENLTHTQKPILVLDLDQTLLYPSVAKVECDFTVPVSRLGRYYTVYIKLRPHAKKFLKIMSEYYDIVIFTAGKEGYASQIVKNLNKEGYIKYALYRDKCITVDDGFIKNLTIIDETLKNVVIVDDTTLSFSLHPENGILISPFVGFKYDDELIKLIPYLIEISQYDDIRDREPYYIIDEIFAVQDMY